MSLDGLDSAQLSEAFDNAQAEPGGWFWIKYITRDEVELLKNGHNGTGEMRATALTEPDDTPLFGYIRFRRRNMLVKYVPNGASRVVKARSQVHFQLFAERFSPHDSTVALSSPIDLNDSVLNSSCSTHTATASISSSNSSLRQRRLTDIAESTDEGGDGLPTKNHGHNRDHSNNNFSNYNRGETTGLTGLAAKGTPTTTGTARHTGGLAVVITSNDTGVSDEGSVGVPAIPDRDPTASSLFLSKGDFSSTNSSTLSEPRRKSTSSSSSRPSATDIYSYYPYVPKVKLGPRPHVEAPKRPHTSNERTKTFQPASAEELRASVPRSVHIPPRKTPTSSKSATLTVNSIPEPQLPPSPTTPTSLYSFSVYSSTASVKTASDGPTPEKQRLMRALQLRRQQQQMAEQERQQHQENIRDPEASLTELMEPTQSGEKTPTGSTITVRGGILDNIDPVMVEPLSSKHEVGIEEIDVIGNSGTDGFDNGNCITASPVASIGSHARLGGPKESEKSDEMDLMKEELMGEEAPKDDDVSAGQTDTEKIVIQENHQEPETVTEDPASPDSEIDKLDGTTKVRDDVDEESDEGSIVSLETPVSEPRPSCIQSKPAIQPVPVPIIAKSAYRTERKASIVDTKSMPPPKLSRRVGSTTIPANETPVIETARSVSAPFLKSARVESKPVTVKKVNVGGGGSVSQRIRQFQQLATNPPQMAATFTGPPRTPTKSRSNSPIPEFLGRPQSSMSNKSPPGMNSVSNFETPMSTITLVPGPALVLQRNSMLMPTPTPAPASVPQRNSIPPPPPPKDTSPIPTPLVYAPVRSKLEIVEKDNRPQLQVTTKINWEEGKPQYTRSPSVSPHSPKSFNPPPPATSSSSSLALDVKQQKGAEVSPSDTLTLRRSSIDLGANSSQRSSSDKGQRPRLFSRSSKDKDKELKDVPESVSATAALTEMSRRGSTASAKSPKAPGFLKRVSSTLSRKKDPSPPPRQIPVESAKKTILHAGSINVQLPDTMLWKRRFMKIDSDGWLCLSLTDDENAPQTRKYHIASEVRKIDLPDVDEQELPHSVRLMLREGGMLQCACQNSAEQKQVLSVVRSCLA